MSRYFRHPDALWREEAGGHAKAVSALDEGADAEDIGTSVVLFRGKVVSLNLLGTEIWKLCDGRSFEEIVAALGADFEVEDEVLRDDVSRFLASLKTQGLIDER